MHRIKAGLVMLALALLSAAACGDAVESPTAVRLEPAAAAGSSVAMRWGLASARFQQESVTSSAVISAAGGWLRAGDHYLEVRPGAVAAPTRFVMSLRAGEHFMVDLHAYRPNGRAVSAFPPNTVNLHMVYRDAVVAEGAAVAIGYITGETTGSPAIVPLRVDADPSLMLVSANLLHFSLYALIVD